MNIFVTKPIDRIVYDEEHSTGERHLKRTMGAKSLVASASGSSSAPGFFPADGDSQPLCRAGRCHCLYDRGAGLRAGRDIMLQQISVP